MPLGERKGRRLRLKLRALKLRRYFPKHEYPDNVECKLKAIRGCEGG